MQLAKQSLSDHAPGPSKTLSLVALCVLLLLNSPNGLYFYYFIVYNFTPYDIINLKLVGLHLRSTIDLLNFKKIIAFVFLTILQIDMYKMEKFLLVPFKRMQLAKLLILSLCNLIFIV